MSTSSGALSIEFQPSSRRDCITSPHRGAAPSLGLSRFLIFNKFRDLPERQGAPQTGLAGPASRLRRLFSQKLIAFACPTSQLEPLDRRRAIIALVEQITAEPDSTVH